MTKINTIEDLKKYKILTYDIDYAYYLGNILERLGFEIFETEQGFEDEYGFSCQYEYNEQRNEFIAGQIDLYCACEKERIFFEEVNYQKLKHLA